MATAPTSNSPPAAGPKSTAVRIPLSEPAAPESSLPAGASPSDGSDLAALDQQLSDDLDEMLQGEFESIEKVLDEVFDEKAAIVQREGGMPAELNKSRQAASDVVSARQTQEPPAPTASAPPPTPPEVVTPSLTSEPTAMSHAAPVEEVPVATTSPVAAEPPVAAQVTAAPPPVEDASVSKADTEHEAARAESTSTVPKPAAEQSSSATSPPFTAAATAPAIEPSPRKRFAFLQPAVRLLAVLNLPFRAVPRSMRPLIDWAALTLLFWTPVVWVLVFLNRGPDHAAGVMHEESALSGHTTTMHGESKLTPAEAVSHEGATRETSHAAPASGH